MTTCELPRQDLLPLVVVALMKGVLDREENPIVWQALAGLAARAREYVQVLGLELILDEGEGYAFLRQRTQVDGEPELPRLVARRQLGYSVSLLLVLLRKRLAELDAGGGDTRLILSRSQIADLVRLFQQDRTNEARAADRVDADISKVVELGFLRRLRGDGDAFEVRRLLKSFIDAQWMDGFEQRLAAYRGRDDAAPAASAASKDRADRKDQP
jgi:hypothetical protein